MIVLFTLLRRVQRMEVVNRPALLLLSLRADVPRLPEAEPGRT